MLNLRLMVDPFLIRKLTLGFACFVACIQLTYASPNLNEKDTIKAKQLALSDVEKWIGSPVGTQRLPWFVCVRMQGMSLMYKAKLYAIQARYQSWTAEWHRFRPQPYPSDDGVGLVTTKELAQLYVNLQRLAAQKPATYKAQTRIPPCGPELYEEKVKKSFDSRMKSNGSSKYIKYNKKAKRQRKAALLNKAKAKAELVVDLWLLSKSSPLSSNQTWQNWKFIDPHLSLEQEPQLMVNQVIELITKVAPENEDSDRLIKTKDSGTLLLTVTAPSKVWLNGVYHGLWPSSQPVYLATGHYRVHVVPLDSNISPITFEGLEMSAGVKTKFKVEVE